MPHGYYSLEGEFVETGTKEEATVAWRKERGYSTTTTTAASNLARTLTGIDRSAEVTARAGVRTPATTSFVRRPVEPVAPLPSWWGKPTGGGAEPVAAQPGFVRRPVTAPVRQPQTSIFGEPIDLGGQIGLSFADVPLGREPYRDERRYDLSSRFGVPPAVPNVIDYSRLTPGEPSRLTGPEYPAIGSEQAYLGPVAQAEEFFLGAGERRGLGSSYIGISQEDRKPPAALSLSTIRILTSDTDVTIEDIERIYEYNPETGHYLLKESTGRDGVWDGAWAAGGAATNYPRASGPGYTGRYAGASGGLINWRIGF